MGVHIRNHNFLSTECVNHYNLMSGKMTVVWRCQKKLYSMQLRRSSLHKDCQIFIFNINVSFILRVGIYIKFGDVITVSHHTEVYKHCI
jgi:hypothetical protein